MNEETKKSSSKLIIIIICAVILAALIGAGIFFLTRGKENPNKNGNTTPDKKEEEVIPFESDLDFKMKGNELSNLDLAFIQMENVEDNKIYSPLSIKYALSMLSIATDGDSKKQIDNILGDYVAKRYESLEEVSVANAMFVNKKFEKNVDSNYKDRIQNKFNAEVIVDEFKSADAINKWVKKNTLNLIDKLFEDNEIKNNRFILINALGIDMEWMQELEREYSASYAHENIKAETKEYDDDNRTTLSFNGNNVKGYEVAAVINNYNLIAKEGETNIRNTVTKKYNEFLSEETCTKGLSYAPASSYVEGYISDLKFNYKRTTSSTDFKVYVDDDTKVFAKKLKDYNGSQLEYVAIMPTNEKLTDFIKNTDSEKINKLLSSLKELDASSFEEGYVTIVTGKVPEFKFEGTLNLDNDLKNLGITDVFDSNKANFKRMTDLNDLYIKTRHKALIDFSNSGIKAAAVTAMQFTENALEYENRCAFDYIYDVPTKNIDITIDKPFLFLIRDAETNEVWFTGTVYNPTNA